jgi:4-amino-4-deoxy-L-arabinose transferase-like glycosyltransferase
MAKLERKITIFSLIFILLLSFILRLNLTQKSFTSNNEAILLTEAIKLSYGERPQPYTASWAPNFVSTWHGYFISVLRAVLFWLSPYNLSLQWLVNTVFGTLTVLLVFILAKQLYGKYVAFLSSTLFAIFPLNVILSRTFYLEIPLTFFIIFSFVIFFYEKKRNKYHIFSAILLGVASIIKIFAILVLLPMFVAMYLSYRKNLRKFFLHSFYFSFIVLLIFATWAFPNLSRIIELKNPTAGFSYFSFSLGIDYYSVYENVVSENYNYLFSRFLLLLITIGFILPFIKKDVNGVILALTALTFLIFFQFLSSNNLLRFHVIMVPIYLILASNAIITIILSKIKRPLNLVFLLIFSIFLINFTYNSLRLDLFGFKLNTGEDYRFDSFASNVLVSPGSNELGSLSTIRFLQKNIKINDSVYLSSPLHYYDSFLWMDTRNIFALPNYDVCTLNQSDDIVCDNQNWKITIQQLRDNSNIGWIAVADSMLYERVFREHTNFHIINYSAELNKNFTQVFSICFPNEQFTKEICDFNKDKHCLADDFMCDYVYKGSSHH